MKRLHVVIAEPSVIVRSGLIAVLQQINTLNISIAEITESNSLLANLAILSPDVIVINPIHFLTHTPSTLRNSGIEARFVALQSAFLDSSVTAEYDGSISIYDSMESIKTTLSNVAALSEDGITRNERELSQREKEIVVCIAKGMSNKEIADALSLSTHTVISHRRNITTKLEIYSASGLTIYAITNRLIEIESIPAK